MSIPRTSNQRLAFLRLGIALLTSACGERIIVFGPPPAEDTLANTGVADDSRLGVAANTSAGEWSLPVLHEPLTMSDADLGQQALALMAGPDGTGGSCGSCHALGRPTLTRWRQLTDTFRNACLETSSPSDGAGVDRLFRCFEEQSSGATFFSPSAFGVYAAAAHLPWFSFLFEHASRFAGDWEAQRAEFIARVGMPRAGDRLTQAQFDLVVTWFERGLPGLFELVPEQNGGDCVAGIDPGLLAHVDEMAGNGWRAKNEQVPLLMFGCDSGQRAGQCLLDSPLALDSTAGARWDPPGTARIRILYDSSASLSHFWSRSSADGRYFASGLRSGVSGASGQVVDLAGERTIPADFAYDPTFFPDNSGFLLQRTNREQVAASTNGAAQPGDEAVICPQSVLAENPALLTGNESGCAVIGGTIGLYQQLARSVDGGDYWVAHGVYVEDNGGFEPVLANPSASFGGQSTTTLTPMINGGALFGAGTPTRTVTPFQGDPMLSPSGRLLVTRVQGRETTGLDGGEALIVAEQSGYAIHRVTTTSANSASTSGASANSASANGAPTAALEEVGRICLQGGKAMLSYDERWLVIHHYVTADDATALGFTGPGDPAFAAYLERGAANLYLVDLRDGSNQLITRMEAGQYALYPHFRSDGWIYFVVRTLDGSEYFAATDAALVREADESATLTP